VLLACTLFFASYTCSLQFSPTLLLLYLSVIAFPRPIGSLLLTTLLSLLPLAIFFYLL